LFTAAYDEAADICSTMSPKLVLKVASQTDVVGMQSGGAEVKRTTRFVDPVTGGQVGATAVAVSGWVVGVGNVLVVVVLEVEVVEVVVVVVVAVFEPLLTAKTMRTIAAATATAMMARRRRR
jgi:hypothetical protein